MKVLVTGAAGFIGSHLVARLLADGHHVVGFDNLMSATEENVCRIGRDFPNQWSWIKGDVRDFSCLNQAMLGCSAIVHLAAAGSVPDSIERPDFYHDNNVTGTWNALMAARQNGLSRFVFASSAAVYGDRSTLPNSEDGATYPLSPYAANKVIGEAYCSTFYRAYGLPTVIFRFFNVFGPRQNPKSQYAAAIPKFIEACRIGDPITIFGDGHQTRDFIYVGDVVDAIFLGLRCDSSHLGTCINVASGTETSVLDLANTIRRLSEVGSSIRHADRRAGDIVHSYAVVDRLKRLGLVAHTPLEDGLRRVIGFESIS
ncbi:NAD-dependent epimerase/dehydratase family protein [bacterium]|nr:NAD-dependent epimerase/dehydratase family protein [bacterium]